MATSFPYVSLVRSRAPWYTLPTVDPAKAARMAGSPRPTGTQTDTGSPQGPPAPSPFRDRRRGPLPGAERATRPVGPWRWQRSVRSPRSTEGVAWTADRGRKEPDEQRRTADGRQRGRPGEP